MGAKVVFWVLPGGGGWVVLGMEFSRVVSCVSLRTILNPHGSGFDLFEAKSLPYGLTLLSLS